LVHRDIKPQNLMLTPKGQVKILDFGLASFVSEGGAVGSLTEFGQGLGTPDYVAPEQIRDARSSNIRADIYSLGCTLYCLLTSQPPFPEGSVSQKIAAHLEQTPRPIADLRGDLPDGLALIVERMMAKGPDHRYQKPVEVAEALAPFAKGDDRGPQRPGGWQRPNRYLLGAGAIALLIASVFLFDVPGNLSPFVEHQNDEAQSSNDPQGKEDRKPVPNVESKDKVPLGSDRKDDLDSVTFTDVYIEKPFREILLCNPGLMETPGAKIIKTPEGNFLLVLREVVWVTSHV
jgi:serine/threonine protein kinase